MSTRSTIVTEGLGPETYVECEHCGGVKHKPSVSGFSLEVDEFTPGVVFLSVESEHGAHHDVAIPRDIFDKIIFHQDEVYKALKRLDEEAEAMRGAQR